MKAIVRDGYGAAGVLRLDDIDRPAIGAKDVLVAVRAAGVDRGAWHAMTGTPLAARLGFADLEALVAVTPAVDRVFPLAEAPAAMRRLADGSACGKVILAV